MGNFTDLLIKGTFFRGKRYALILTKKCWAVFWAIFLTNSSGHPGCVAAFICTFDESNVFVLGIQLRKLSQVINVLFFRVEQDLLSQVIISLLAKNEQHS
jgi:hypothetical protein